MSNLACSSGKLALPAGIRRFPVQDTNGLKQFCLHGERLMNRWAKPPTTVRRAFGTASLVPMPRFCSRTRSDPKRVVALFAFL